MVRLKSLTSTVAVAVLCGILALSAGSRPALAASKDRQEPFLLMADEVTYDQDLGTVTARGHVEVSQGSQVLLADTISYNQHQDVLTANGNISLLEPSGEVVFADYMELTGNMKDGILRDIRMLLSDHSRLAANGARRSDGVVTEMSKAVYSPCNLCAGDPSRPPLWQIKAVKVIHNNDRHTIEYKDAWMEIAGVPVIYTPYFQHPDPTVKRQSGFLVPNIGTSSDLGAIVSTPYFFVLGPDKDLTVTPTLTTKEGPVLGAQYRQRFMKGELDAKGSITKDSENSVRGHIDGRMRFDINDTWRWGLDVQRASDDTYLRRYGFSNESTLTSRLFAEGFRQRDYASINAYSFQGLSSTADPGTTPLVLPMVNFNHVGEPDRLGGRSSLDLNMVALTRTDGTDTRRMSVKAGWELPYVGPLGDIYKLEASLRGDLYDVHDLLRSGKTGSFSGVSGRVRPEASLTWRYPWVRDDGQIQQVVEPIAMAVISPYGGNPSTIPNEDSLDFELDDTNLFSTDRFVGLDRVESGPRVNYGLRWGVYGAGGGSTSLLVGQSYRTHADSTFAVGSGLEDHFSDIVARVQVSPTANYHLYYRTRLDKSTLSPKRNEIDLSLGSQPVRLNVGYVFFSDQAADEFPGRKEISASLDAQLTRYWHANMSLVRDLSKTTAGTRQAGLRLTYEDECFAVTTNFLRSFYQDRDLKPSDSIIVRLVFKTLGQFSTAVQ